MRGEEYADCRKEYQTVRQPSDPWFHDPNLLLMTSGLKIKLERSREQISGSEDERAVVDDCPACFAEQSKRDVGDVFRALALPTLATVGL
jgi:hypothetical protein